ncbi:MAG: 4Fe-4S dicluster domain-containing protein [Planctomycetota bacterium]|nr:4Fe-4S dicluster domain-containing protein [Planctomycetota bacterium]
MIKTILQRLRQGHRTIRYPAAPPPPLPARFRGRPRINRALCPPDCRLCQNACPTGALSFPEPADPSGSLRVDLGRCLFCTDCSSICPRGAITHDSQHSLAVSHRLDLVVSDDSLKLAESMGEKLRRTLGRALRLRQVSAGGCNACEADTNVLTTVGWDISRFGLQFVASPRHADGLLVTGCVSENMRLALLKTYAAVPSPKIVIAVGACAISGGPYIDHPEVHNGCSSFLDVDLFIPGCPPHPLTILDGLLRLLGRVS